MIRAREDPAVLTIDVVGPATMAESPAVNELSLDRVSKGVHEIRIDLRDCTSMDSTFSGLLLSLKRKLDAIGGKLTLLSPSKRVVELHGKMGLEDFYDVANAERASGPWHLVANARPSIDELEQLVLDAHDELARLPVPQAAQFRPVVEELRRSRTSAKPLH